MLKPFTDIKVPVDESTKIPARTGEQKGYFTIEDLAEAIAPILPPSESGGGVTPVILNTLADYLALTPEQQIDPSKIYGVKVQS